MKMAITIAVPLALVMGMSIPAQAQMWGTGMWGANQACSYPYGAGAGSSSGLDGVRQLQSDISRAKRTLSQKQNEARRLKSRLDGAIDQVEDTIESSFASVIFEHIENGRSCDSYQNVGGSNRFDPYSDSEWQSACAGSYPGVVSNQYVCDLPRSQYQGGRSSRRCTEGLRYYTSNYRKLMKLQEDIEDLEIRIEDWEDEIEYAKEDYMNGLQDGTAGTEGGYCFDCVSGGTGTVQGPGVNWNNVIANGLVGGLAMYMGYQTNKMISQNNAALGWPSQAYPTWGYGLPYIQNAIYGALGGGIGQGGFGCGGGINGGGNMMGPFGMGGMGPGGMYGYPYGNGMYGYPGNMMGGMGGGMYMPGMGPWGMNNGMGGMGMGYPGMGYPGMGGMMAPSMGMMGGMGMPMTGGMGMPMMGGMGMPMMGGMGMPMMGGMGMPMTGGMGMPMTGGMGMPMTGGMGMPMMGGMGMPMGGYDMSSQMQMQQQMMQMQMQQYQAMMQQQMAAQQSYMQRQQVVAGLQQEMYQLAYRIQQVQMGGGVGFGGGYGMNLGGGGGGGFIGIGGGGSYGNGSGYLGTPISPAPVQGTIGR